MRLVLDRIELDAQKKRIAVFESDDELINVSEDLMPSGLIDKLFAGIIVDADYVDGRITKAELLVNETEKKRAEMKSRLSRFSSKKK